MYEVTYNIEDTFFELVADPNGTFTWITLKQKLKYSRHAPILAYIDDDKVNCYPKTTPTVCSCGTTTTTTITISGTTSTNPKTGW